MINKNEPKIAFFGTPKFAVTILDELKKAGIIPNLIITAPDKPKGRGLVLSPSPVKVWAQENHIEVSQPEKIKSSEALFKGDWDIFIVAAYGKIIPESILNIPKYKTLNVHPSLLPKYRGSCPIETSILNDDKDVGVTIMRLDKEMDHGPIIAQEKIPSLHSWPITASELEDISAHFGEDLLARTILLWVKGEIKEKEQDHSKATYCKKISKKDGELDLSQDPYQNFLKICAYSDWPGTYFMKTLASGKNIRVSIKSASYSENELKIHTVVPEGKSEMPYLDFLRGIK